VVAGPGDEIAAAEGRDRGDLRASHADREQATEQLKVAFAQGRLDKDEFDAWSWRSPSPIPLCWSSLWGGSSPAGRIGVLLGSYRGDQDLARAVRHPSARQRPARADSSRRPATVSSTPPKRVDAIVPMRDRPARGQLISGAIADTATRSAMPAIDSATANAGRWWPVHRGRASWRRGGSNPGGPHLHHQPYRIRRLSQRPRCRPWRG
jgi:hypothetical protein